MRNIAQVIGAFGSFDETTSSKNAFTPGSFIDLMFLPAAPGMWVTCLDLSTPWLWAASEIPIVAAAMPAAIPSVLNLSMIHPLRRWNFVKAFDCECRWSDRLGMSTAVV